MGGMEGKKERGRETGMGSRGREGEQRKGEGREGREGRRREGRWGKRVKAESRE